jgi:tetratricopeptide (TPR) repeat protein
MDRAAKALRKRRYARALSLYQTVLEREPKNADLHRRVAPLFARTRQVREAWASYRQAADHLLKAGFVDQAVGVYREACQRLPSYPDPWISLSELEVERGRPRDAVAALMRGRRRFRSRRNRTEAMRLLRRARKIDPQDFEVTFDLAGLVGQSGMRAQSIRMLDELASRATRSQLRRVRRRQFLLAPGPSRAWRWLRALLGSPGPQPALSSRRSAS